jgi:hypothetical protein
VRTARGWQRRRYSQLDPVRLATLLEVVDEAERPGVWRRLGDLALFLTGVFPDHTDARALGSVQTVRLLRSTGLAWSGAVTAVGWRCWSCWAGTGTGWPMPAHRPWQVGEVADRFEEGRRVLNLVANRHLSGHCERWFPA